jgi:hypothetical protein
MRTGRMYGLATVGVAAAMVAVPLPAMADETADAATGDLVVTRFDDRYADGLFDTSKTAPSGDVDRLNTSHAAQLIDVNGTRWYVSADADGLYRFPGVPVGPATLYLGYPNNPPGEALFDATGARSAADIARLATTEYFGPQGTLELTIDEDGEERLIGMTALRLVANVRFADGSPAAGLTTVEFGSGDEWYPATEYSFRAGTYEAFQGSGYVRHLPGDLGVRLTVPDGYLVTEVTAGDNGPFDVTERDGAYFFDSAQVWNYFWNPAFTITLEQDTTAPTVTVKQGAPYTAHHGSRADGTSFNKVSFTLSDAGEIDRISINGVVTDLVDDTESDVDFVKPGTFGAVAGENTLVVYDVAGNAQTLTFTLK